MSIPSPLQRIEQTLERYTMFHKARQHAEQIIENAYTEASRSTDVEKNVSPSNS